MIKIAQVQSLMDVSQRDPKEVVLITSNNVQGNGHQNIHATAQNNVQREIRSLNIPGKFPPKTKSANKHCIDGI